MFVCILRSHVLPPKVDLIIDLMTSNEQYNGVTIKCNGTLKVFLNREVTVRFEKLLEIENCTSILVNDYDHIYNMHSKFEYILDLCHLKGIENLYFNYS